MKKFGLKTMESMQILGAAYWLFWNSVVLAHILQDIQNVSPDIFILIGPRNQ